MKLSIFGLALFTQISIQAQDWTPINSNSTEDLKKIMFKSENLGFILGFNGTLLQTTNGGLNWEQANISVDHDLYTISFANENVGFINGLKTIDGGFTWTEQSSSADFALIHAFDENTLIAGDVNFSGNLYKSIDGGETWTIYANPIIDSGLPSGSYNDICFITENLAYLSAWYSGNLFRTTNGGDSWEHIAIEEVDGVIWSSDDFLSVDFLTESTGILSHENGVLKTSDGGNTWSEIKPANLPNSFYVTQIIALNEFNYILTGGIAGDLNAQEKIYETTDGGLTWSATTGTYENFIDLTCTSSKCFAVGREGALYSKDNIWLSTPDITEIQSPSISPNPTKGFLEIKNEGETIEKIELFTLQGDLQSNVIIDANRIDVSNLPSGIYLIRTSISGIVYSSKFIKN